MNIQKEITAEELETKLQTMLDQLNLSSKIKTDDIKNVIYHEDDLKGSMKIISAFTDYAKTKKQFDLVAESVNLAWNYLPHKSLNNLSPYQKMQEYYFKKKVAPNKPPKYNSTKSAVYQLFEESLPEKIYLKKVRDNEWSFVFSSTYHKTHIEFHKFYQSEEFSEYELAEKTISVLLEEPLLMEAASYLAHLFLKLGGRKEATTTLEKSIGSIKNIFPKEFDWKKDKLPWYFLENRDFLNLLLDQAIFIEKGESVLKSIPYYEQIISLNPNDNQGVRGILTTLYLKTNQPQAVIELSKKYPSDATQELIMGHVLALIKLGKLEDARKQLKKIFNYSKHVIKELLKPIHTQPQSFNPERIQLGGKDEAYLYWREQGSLWQATRGTMDLLRKFIALLT